MSTVETISIIFHNLLIVSGKVELDVKYKVILLTLFFKIDAKDTLQPTQLSETVDQERKLQ